MNMNINLAFMQTLTEPVNLHNTSLRLDGGDLIPRDINPSCILWWNKHARAGRCMDPARA
jgi:hypothetical protein